MHQIANGDQQHIPLLLCCLGCSLGLVCVRLERRALLLQLCGILLLLQEGNQMAQWACCAGLSLTCRILAETGTTALSSLTGRPLSGPGEQRLCWAGKPLLGTTLARGSWQQAPAQKLSGTSSWSCSTQAGLQQAVHTSCLVITQSAGDSRHCRTVAPPAQRLGCSRHRSPWSSCQTC